MSTSSIGTEIIKLYRYQRYLLKMSTKKSGSVSYESVFIERASKCGMNEPFQNIFRLFNSCDVNCRYSRISTIQHDREITDWFLSFLFIGYIILIILSFIDVWLPYLKRYIQFFFLVVWWFYWVILFRVIFSNLLVFYSNRLFPKTTYNI